MKKICWMFIGLMGLSACLDQEQDVALDESQYNGTFMRLEIGKNPVESPVTLMLNNGTYTGQADSLYYPAICQGTYTVEGNRITFANDCPWTANFDWSLILFGTYTVDKQNGETVLIQEVGDNLYNVYKLKN